MKIRFLLLPLLFVVIAGCNESLPNGKLEYVGQWKSSEMELLILADGSVAYKRTAGNVTTSVYGRLKKFIGDDFVVGILFFTTTFEVSEQPRMIKGRWQMVVDGVRLIRVNDEGFYILV